MADPRPTIEYDTIPEIDVVLAVLKVAEGENLSVTSALEEAQERIRDEAINSDHKERRGFYLNIMLYRQVIDVVATERMREQLRQNVRTLEQSESELSGVEINLLLDVIEEITFEGSVMSRHGDRLSVIKLADQLDNDGLGSEILGLLSDIAGNVLDNLNKELIQEVTDTFEELAEILPPEPDTEDWQAALYEFNQNIGELDREGRYLGDV